MNDPSPTRIPLARPFVGEEELSELREVLQSRTLTRGPKVAAFEQAVAEHVGVKHAIATTSATTALHLSLVALGLQRGDDVLVPDFTFPATANVVIQQGCRPVLVDIDLDSFTMSLDDLERKITPRSRAIMPVHAFGRAANMVGIMKIAAQHGLSVIEDAACSLGAAWKGRQTGSIGHAGCFSFHPRKVITTGEGGMVTTSDDALAEKMRMLRNHGGIREDGRFVFHEAGFNYWMSDLQGAVGVAQMRKLSQLNVRRQELASDLTDRFKGIPGVRTPSAGDSGEHIFQSYVLLLDRTICRDSVISKLRHDGIESTLGTYALHAQPCYQRDFDYRTGDLPNSLRAYEQTITLPMYHEIDGDALNRIAKSLQSAIVGDRPSRGAA